MVSSSISDIRYLIKVVDLPISLKFENNSIEDPPGMKDLMQSDASSKSDKTHLGIFFT